MRYGMTTRYDQAQAIFYGCKLFSFFRLSLPFSFDKLIQSVTYSYVQYSTINQCSYLHKRLLWCGIGLYIYSETLLVDIDDMFHLLLP